MKLNKNLLLLGLIFWSINGFAQMSGNQVYGQNNRYYNNSSSVNGQGIASSIRAITDSTITLSAKVLLKQLPDYYLVTIGASETAKTVKECNSKINKRIKGLTNSLTKLKVKEGEYYVDFIAQTMLYDYEIEGQQASQVQKGFEIKKNIIIKLNELAQFDDLIELCAKQEIYDIIKIDYRNSDINSIHQQMYKEAMTVIENKKNLFLNAKEAALFTKSRLLSDRLYSIFPKNQYKQYQAFETSNVYYSYDSNYIRKEARKRNTFYYDEIDVSGFDKIINGESPIVGIQYVIELTVFFEKK